MYDFAIVGGGINGLVLSRFLKEYGSVAVFERDKTGAGGSGAAGAFLSPKFTKGGELKELINTALDYAFEFYGKNYGEYISFYPLVHIAKDEKDRENLQAFKNLHPAYIKQETPPFLPDDEYIYTEKSAIVNVEILNKLQEDITLVYEDIKEVNFGDVCVLNKKYKAKKVILATGAYHQTIINFPFEMIRGIWGHRIDVRTTTCNDVSVHRYVSVSPSKDSIVSIGATHNVHYHPQTSNNDYDFKKGREELIQKASKTFPLENVKVVKDYVGLRSGSFDYLPVIGGIVDIDKTLKKFPKNELTSKKADYQKFCYVPNLYMINGSAGYGYVLAPYIARILSEHIVGNKPVPKKLSQARFFHRWVKRGFGKD